MTFDPRPSPRRRSPARFERRLEFGRGRGMPAPMLNAPNALDDVPGFFDRAWRLATAPLRTPGRYRGVLISHTPLDKRRIAPRFFYPLLKSDSSDRAGLTLIDRGD